MQAMQYPNPYSGRPLLALLFLWYSQSLYGCRTGNQYPPVGLPVRHEPQKLLPQPTQEMSKTLHIEPISNCDRCPFIALARLSITEELLPLSLVAYCKKKAAINGSSSAIDILAAVNQAVLLPNLEIPDWCPLPNSERNNAQIS